MQVDLVSKKPRKLVAVLAIDGKGVFFPRMGGECVFIDQNGYSNPETQSLERVLAESQERTPIYEGETINLTF